MKTTEKRVTTWEQVHVLGVNCDLCGDDIKQDLGAKVLNINVSMKCGVCYPDGDASGTKWDFDVCESCMRSKIFPLFADAGCDVEGVEYSS